MTGVLLLTLSLTTLNPASSSTDEPEERLAEILDLSAEQSSHLAKLRRARRIVVSPLRASLKKQKTALATLWRASRPNRAAIEAQLASIDHLRRQIRAARLDFRFGLHDLLSPRQRAALSLHLDRKKAARHR